MRKYAVWTLLVSGMALGSGAVPVPAAEEWADKRLPVTGGLELWLDAARQNAARRARGEAAVADGQKLAVWYDASGHGRHLAQKDVRSQPALDALEGYHAVRFD